MNSDLEAFLGALEAAGWKVVRRDVILGEPFLPDSVRERFRAIPEDYLAFLSSISSCVNASDTAWFLSLDDFRGDGGSAFRWNEFELQSLEGAARDRDWQREIGCFWDQHLPILLSVRTGYAYIALRLPSTGGCAVMIGREPEYEEPVTIAHSFSDLCRLIAYCVESGAGHSSLQQIL